MQIHPDIKIDLMKVLILLEFYTVEALLYIKALDHVRYLEYFIKNYKILKKRDYKKSILYEYLLFFSTLVVQYF